MNPRAALALTLLLATCSEPTLAQEGRKGPGKRPPPPAPVEQQISWDKGARDKAPISLTTTDGSGLELVSIEAKAVVQDPVAFTELHLVFRNPEARVREGRFEIALPEGAAISRFAMKVNDQWQEGEVLETQRARRAYEDFLHRRQDPALLEKQAGNEFQARVFPIPANGEKEIILSYSHALDSSGEPYAIPLAGLPKLGRFSADVQVPGAAGPKHLEMQRSDFVPEGDLHLKATQGERPSAVGLAAGGYAVARVQVDLPSASAKLDDLTVLVDTSGSRALGFERQGKELVALMEALPDNLKVRVLYFDQEVLDGYSGPASGFDAEDAHKMSVRGALGASDLGHALDEAVARGWLGSRALIVSDGVFTAGETDAAALTGRLKAAKGLQRVDALAVGGIQDGALLQQLVTALPSAGVVMSGELGPKVVVDKLSRSAASGVRVTVPGAGWVWPETLDGVQPGDEVLIFADLDDGAAMNVQLAGASVRQQPALVPGERHLVERAAVKAEIDRLTAQHGLATDPAQKAELKANIIELSTHYRVLSDFTALLVLETEADYARFGIDRNALADILTVGPNGITTVSRLPPQPLKTPEAPPPVVRRNEDVEKKAKVASRGAPADEGELDADDEMVGDVSFGRDQALDGAPMPVEESEELAKTEEARPEPAPARSAPAERPSPRPASAAMETVEMHDAPPPPPPPPPPASTASAGVRASQSVIAEASEPAAESAAAPRREGRMYDRMANPEAGPSAPAVAATDPWEGPFKEVMDLVVAGKAEAAVGRAVAWQRENPGDVLALVALGEAWEASGRWTDAARAYGTIIDLFPGRADLRRMAGERLERVALRAGKDGARIAEITIDTFREAVEQRPDHPSGHRLLAYALARAGRYDEAMQVLIGGLAAPWPRERFGEVEDIFREDIAILARARLAAKPGDAAQVTAMLAPLGLSPDTKASTRFVLSWETDANDVDFHIYDARGGHAFYSQRDLRSGGRLYADITTGYGPECFTIPGTPAAGPYTLQANYYSRGPMGYGMGTLHVLTHDGKGGLSFDARPFIIQKDQAFVDLGKVGTSAR